MMVMRVMGMVTRVVAMVTIMKQVMKMIRAGAIMMRVVMIR